MENLNSSAPKSKPIVGWICGGLAFVLLLTGMSLGYGFGTWVFFLGGLFAVLTIIIGAVKKSPGQIFLGIAGVLVTVFLVLFLGLAQTTITRVSSTPTNETTSWKTYTNTDYSYSIKYPSAWTVDLKAKDSSGKTLATFLAPGINNAPREKMIDIQVSLTTNVSRVDSADYIKRNGNVIISTTPVVVGGVSTEKFITNLNNGYNMVVYVEKNSETYVLGLRDTTSSDKEYIDNFNLMLSTFKFTN